MEDRIPESKAKQKTYKKFLKGFRRKKVTPERILDPETTAKLLAEIEASDKKLASMSRIKGKIDPNVDITADFQRAFAGNLFDIQVKSSRETTEKEYFGNVKSWQNSIASRTRLVVIEATKDIAIESLAKTIFYASPLERVLVTGLTTIQQDHLKKGLKELWQKRASKNRISDIEKQLESQSAPQLRERETEQFVMQSQALLNAWIAAEKKQNKKEAKKHKKQLKALQGSWSSKHANSAFGLQLQAIWDDLVSNPENTTAFAKNMDKFWNTWAQEHATSSFKNELQTSWTAWAYQYEVTKAAQKFPLPNDGAIDIDAIYQTAGQLRPLGYELEQRMEAPVAIQEEEDVNSAAVDIEVNPFVTDKATVTKIHEAEHDRIAQMELETLMGPHLFQADLDISYDTMSKRFPQFGVNIEEVLCVGESTELVAGLGDLGSNINRGVPIFPVKSKPFDQDEDPGLWRCSCRYPNQFLAEIAKGKTAIELLGKNTEGGYDHVTLSEHFQKTLDINTMLDVLQEQGVSKELIEELSQEDMGYIKSILFDYAIYPPGISPNALEVTRSKSKSLQTAEKADEVGRSYLWNILDRPISTALEVDYQLGFMTSSGGGDIASEDLRKRNAYKLFFEEVLQTLTKKGVTPKEAIAMALSQTAQAYIANEKKNLRIQELERGKTGANAWRTLGVKYANKVKKSNKTGVNILFPSMPLFTARSAGGPAWTAAGFATKITTGLNWVLGGINTGISAVSVAIKTLSMYHQVKANKKYLNIANDGLAIANEKMLEAQDERKTELAIQLEKIQKKLSHKEEHIAVLEKKRDHILGQLTPEKKENQTMLIKELDTIQEQLNTAIIQKLKADPIKTRKNKKPLPLSSVEEENLSTVENKPSLLMRLGINKKKDQNEQRLLDTIKEIQKKTPYIDPKIHADVITAEVQLDYTKGFFEMQAKRSSVITEEAYKDNLNFWMESGSNRARLLVIEANHENLEQLAKSVLDTSPIERLLVAGLSEELKPRFTKNLKKLWEQKMVDTPKLKPKFEAKLKEQLQSRLKTRLNELCAHKLKATPELRLKFEDELDELWEKTSISANDIHEFAETYGTTSQEKQTIQELFQETKTQLQSFDALLENSPLEDLMGPHLFKDDLNLEPEEMANKFGKYDTNIEEIIGFGKDEALVKHLDKLGRNIQSGVPVFSVKSEGLTDADDGLWKCSCKDPVKFLEEIIKGKSATELIGLEPTGGYEHIEMAPTFQRLFQLNEMKAQMEHQQIPEEVIKNLKQEDLDYFQKILLDEALYIGNITPDTLEKVNAKTGSQMECLAGIYIGEGLKWNVVGNPRAIVWDMIFATSNTALDAGGDLYRHQLALKSTYINLFEELKNSYNNGPVAMSPQEACQRALVDATTIFVKLEKLSADMKEQLTKTEEWRGFGLDMANRTKELYDMSIKALDGSTIRFGAGIVLGVIGLGTTAVMPPAGALVLSLGGMSISAWQLAQLTKSTLYMKTSSIEYLPTSRKGVARADVAAQEAQNLRKTLIETNLADVQNGIRSTNGIGRHLVQAQAQTQQQRQEALQVHYAGYGGEDYKTNSPGGEVLWPVPIKDYEVHSSYRSGKTTTSYGEKQEEPEEESEEELDFYDVSSDSGESNYSLNSSSSTRDSDKRNAAPSDSGESNYSLHSSSTRDSDKRNAAPIAPKTKSTRAEVTNNGSKPDTGRADVTPIDPRTTPTRVEVTSNGSKHDTGRADVTPIDPRTTPTIVDVASNGSMDVQDLRVLVASSIPAIPTPQTTTRESSGVQHVPTSKSSKSSQNPESSRRQSLRPW